MKNFLMTLLLGFALIAQMSPDAFSQSTSANALVPNNRFSDGAQVSTGSWWGKNPCLNPNIVLKGATGQLTSTTPVLIGGATGQQVYVCNFEVVGVSGTTPTFQINAASDPGCTTSSGRGVLQPFSLTAGTLVQGIFNYPVPTDASFLCAIAGGTTPVINYSISYVNKVD